MNVVEISGRLSRDPEIRYVGDSRFPILSMNVAVDNGSGRWNRESRKVEYDSGFYQVEVLGEYGVGLAAVLKRGDHVYVKGSLSQWKRPAKEGEESETKTRIQGVLVVPLTNTAADVQAISASTPFVDPSWGDAEPPF